MKYKSVCAVCFVFSSILASPSSAQHVIAVDGQNMTSPYMRVYGMSLPPIGYVRFCDRHPDECATRESDLKRISLTTDRWHDLIMINNYVNQSVLPVTDKELYGRIEHWTYPNSKGDCEDYVLLKRRLLMQKGWPASSLLITVVLDENDEGHAILTARTAQGDFLLDNKNQSVMSWNQSPYRFVKRQSYRDPQTWVSLIPDEIDQQISASGSPITEEDDR